LKMEILGFVFATMGHIGLIVVRDFLFQKCNHS
jgi:hypothetical protein